MRELKPITVRIAAPRVFVFQCLTSYGEPSPVWIPGREPEVLSREGRVLIVRFHERALGGRASAVRVRLHPPQRILYERLEGRPSDVRQELVLVAADGGTDVHLRGDVTVSRRLLRPLVERFLAAPVVHAQARRAMARYRVTIEAAARASGQADEIGAPATSDAG